MGIDQFDHVHRRRAAAFPARLHFSNAAPYRADALVPRRCATRASVPALCHAQIWGTLGAYSFWNPSRISERARLSPLGDRFLLPRPGNCVSCANLCHCATQFPRHRATCLDAPSQLLLLAEREHGRTIPLTDIVPDRLLFLTRGPGAKCQALDIGQGVLLGQMRRREFIGAAHMTEVVVLVICLRTHIPNSHQRASVS